MSEKFTAAMAAALADESDPGKCVSEILDLVKNSASVGKRSLRYRGFGFGSGSCYGSDIPSHCKAIIEELKALGYTANIGVEERQFVDIWLQVSW